MATTRSVIFTHTCDLCGTEQPRDNLKRFGLLPITETDHASSGHAPAGLEDMSITGSPADVCDDCRKQPIAELLKALQDRTAAGRKERIMGSVVIHDPEPPSRL